jgi:hypothetical protein
VIWSVFCMFCCIFDAFLHVPAWFRRFFATFCAYFHDPTSFRPSFDNFCNNLVVIFAFWAVLTCFS